MPSVVVVVKTPTVNHPAGILQAQEQFPIQQLVPQLAIERFHIAVLPGTPVDGPQGFAIAVVLILLVCPSLLIIGLIAVFIDCPVRVRIIVVVTICSFPLFYYGSLAFSMFYAALVE
jgi:hypothetical protein